MPDVKKSVPSVAQEPTETFVRAAMQTTEVRSGARVFGWVVVVVLIVGAFVAGYFVNASMQQRKQVPVAPGTPTTTTPADTTGVVDADPLKASFLATGRITWEVTPKEVPVTFFTANMDSNQPHQQWLVGRVTGETPWKGAEVLLVRGNALISDGNAVFLRVLRHNGMHVVLNKYSRAYVGVGLGDGFTVAERAEQVHVAPGTAWADNIMLEELEFGEEVTAAKEKLVFTRLGNSQFDSWNPFTMSEVRGIAWFGDVEKYEPAVQLELKRSNGPEFVTLYKEKKVSSGELYVRLPDSTYITYQMRIPFMVERPTEGRTAMVVWNNGAHNTQGYGEYEAGGCGITTLRITDGVTLQNNPEFKLAGKVPAGFEGGGDARIYEFRDSHHILLREMYKNELAGFEYRHPDVKLTYDAFVAMHPIIFWQDPFGRVYELHSDEFMPAAECGKPVIYLYPEKTQQVNVQVRPMDGFSVTEPLYPTGGWNVIAEPSGRLTDTRDNKNWSYLFWEGKGSVVGTPETRGFVVARAEVPAFLERTLTSLGLNTQERKDFTEFWTPRMQRAPYYFVTFYGNELMNRIAPLRVTPRPDTTIRILMDYKPLMERKTVEPLPITTPTRDGFTVVEWGGVLR